MARLAFPASIALRVAGFLAAASATAAAQGDTGFLRGRGKTDLSLSYAAESYDEFFVGSDKTSTTALGKVTHESFNLHAAYGLTNDLDLFVAASWVDAENDGTAAFHDETALQDAIGGAKWRLVGPNRFGPGNFSFLVAPSVKIPMTHYEAKLPTAIGDGQVDYRARAIAHYRLDCGIWASVESGFDYRMEGPGNEMPLNVTVGFPITPFVTVSPFWSAVISDGSGDIGQVDLPAVEEEYQRAGVTIYARLDKSFGLTAGVKTTLDGKNTGDLDGYWIGLVWSF